MIDAPCECRRVNDDEITPPLQSGVMRVAGDHAADDGEDDHETVFDVERFVEMTGSEPPPPLATSSAASVLPKRVAG